MQVTQLLVALGLATVATAQSPCGGTTLNVGTENVLSVNGRTVRTYIPSQLLSANATRPAIINFHGYGGSGAGMASTLNEEAEKENWIHAYPDGSGLVRGWNGQGCCPGVLADDVQFTKDIIATLEAEACLDTSNVFATGFSNGGFMAYKLMCEEGDMFKGIAPVAGTLTERGTGPGSGPCTNPGSGTTVVHFHGTVDPTISYGGGPLQAGAQESVDRSAELYGCDMTEQQVYQNGRTTCMRRTGCNNGVSVELCTMTLTGHTWPRGGNTGVDAGEYMMEVFMNMDGVN